MKNTELLIPIAIFSTLLFLAGIGNGVLSYCWSCSSQYLDLRKPIHYVLFPHTIGYYTGRVLGYPYGEDKRYESNCDNIFNHTLEGPRK